VRLLIAAICLLAPASSHGQGEGDPSRVHYDRGVEAFRRHDLDSALAEFEAAYRISRWYKLLYNIGQLNAALGRPAKAVAAFEAYLTEGGDEVPTARRRDVRAEIDREYAYLGTIIVETEPIGADVSVDGEAVGRTPLPGPLPVASGRHVVEVRLADHEPERREVDVVSGAEIAIHVGLALVAARPAPSREVEDKPKPPEREPALSTALDRAPRASDERTRSWMQPLGIVVGAVGIAAIGTGAVVAWRSAEDAVAARSAAATAAHSTSGTPDLAVYDKARHDYDSARTWNQWGLRATAAGAALSIVGVVLMIAAPPRDRRTALAPFWEAESGRSFGVTLQASW
jgi:hypothetical protein